MISMLPYRDETPATDLDTLAHSLALLDAAASDRLVAAQVAQAVREHRIDDAVRWHRIRLRAIRFRAIAATAACRG